MGVAVLQPHDCLRRTTHSPKPLISPPPTMKLPNPNPKPNRPARTHSSRHKRPAPNPNRPDVKPQVNKLVIGQVKILKRGDHLTQTPPDLKTAAASEVALDLKTEAAVDGLYAGYSMCVASPPPSSVPLPVFVTKKTLAVTDATNDLRKMLRLDFS